jgi:predicted DCC family thiol-disulfide oxidoreductase YuxK
MSGEPYIVFYDGRCQICRRARQNLERFGATAPLRFVDVNDAGEMARYPEMAGADVLGQMYVREPGGKVSGGFDAIAALAPVLPAVAWLSPVLRLGPVRAVGRRVYRWVADNRYRLGGQAPCHGGACGFNPAIGRPRGAAPAQSR